MNTYRVIPQLLFLLFCLAIAGPAAEAPAPPQAADTGGNPLTDAEIRTLLRDWVDIDKLQVGMVVGLVDEHGTRVVSYGKLGNATDREVDGDTLFGIGSITKVFTALLLQDLVEQGSVRLEDPAQKYLPDSFKLPVFEGKPITLLHLATHTSGLPRDGGGDTAKLLAGCKLTRPPGTKWDYSNFGVGLLVQIITRQAGKDYESLVLERICRPLGMNSTRLTITPELKPRLAGCFALPGHRLPGVGSGAGGVGGIHSTVNDVLKFVSAYAGMPPSPLSSLMEKAAVPHKLESGEQRPLVWFGADPVFEHGGLINGFRSELAFDRKRRRGVVILANCIYCQTALPALWEPLLRGNSPRPRDVASIDPQSVSRYVGKYREEKGKGFCLVRLRGERFVLQWSVDPTDQPRYDSYEVFPVSDSVFHNDFFQVEAAFSGGTNGRPARLVLRPLAPNSPPRELTRLVRVSREAPEAPDPVPANPRIYDDYAGQYRKSLLFGLFHLGPTLSVAHTSDALGDHLLGQVRGYGETELFPKTKTDFVVSPGDADLRLRFVRPRGGKASAVIVHWNGVRVRGSRISDQPTH